MEFEMSDLADIALNGSKNLDVMKQQVLALMNMVTTIFKSGAPIHAEELAPYLGGEETILGSALGSDKIFWTIAMDGSYRPYIKCRTNAGQVIFHYSTVTGDHMLSMENTERVREVLGDFIGKMFKNFPWVEEEMQPILKAGRTQT
jgi:hypothetical protein